MDRPLKRAKIFRACSSCVSSKVKCEDLLNTGCKRCRHRGTACSLLAEASPEPFESESHLHTHHMTAELLSRVEDLEGRLRGMEALESRLHMRESRSTPLPIGNGSGSANGSVLIPVPAPLSTSGTTGARSLFAPSPITPVGPGIGAGQLDRDALPRAEPTTFFLRRNYTGSADYILSFFDEIAFSHVHPTAVYPDPEAMGIVTPDQMTMCYQTFKHRFAQIAPLPRFLEVTSPCPAHPFLKLAILVYTAPLHAFPLGRLLEHSIGMVLRSAVGMDVMLALYILCLAPASPEETTATYTPLRLAGLAYQVGMDMGLESKLRTDPKELKRLYDPGFQPKLEEVLLWESVKNRYDFLRLTQCPIIPINRPMVDFSPHFSVAINQTITHLRRQAQLLAIGNDIVSYIIGKEHDAYPENLVDLGDLGARWDRFAEMISGFQASLEKDELLSFHDSQAVLLCASLRLLSFLQTLPSPFGLPHRIPAGQYHDPFLRSVKDIIKSFIALPAAHLHFLPAYLLDVYLFATLAGHRTCAHILKMEIRFVPLRVMDVKAVAQAEDRMVYEVRGVHAQVVRRMQEDLGIVQPQMQEGSDGEGGGGGGGAGQQGGGVSNEDVRAAWDALGLGDLFDMDFDWSQMMTGMTGMTGMSGMVDASGVTQ